VEDSAWTPGSTPGWWIVRGGIGLLVLMYADLIGSHAGVETLAPGHSRHGSNISATWGPHFATVQKLPVSSKN